MLFLLLRGRGRALFPARVAVLSGTSPSLSLSPLPPTRLGAPPPPQPPKQSPFLRNTPS